MTFEEINHNIIAGIPCGSFDEAAESLKVLSEVGRCHSHKTALLLAEFNVLWDEEHREGSWVKAAMEIFDFPADNPLHHARATGEMLRQMRSENLHYYKVFFDMNYTCLDELKKVFNLQGGAKGVVNFCKAHPQFKRIKRDELRGLVNKYLGKEKAVKSEQLTLQLTFDVLGDQIYDSQLAAITTCPDFDSYAAWTLSWNGTTLLKNALPTLELYADDFDIDDLEGMCADLAAASERITKILNLKKSNILG